MRNNMPKLIIFATMILFSFSSFADKLSELEVLELKLTKSGYVAKMKDKVQTPEGFFFVKITKEDKDSFEKIAQLLRKAQTKNKSKLILDIKSFSPLPAGSIYSSTHVKFEGEIPDSSLIP